MLAVKCKEIGRRSADLLGAGVDNDAVSLGAESSRATEPGVIRPWRKPTALFVASFVVYAITSSRRIVSLDVETAYLAAWRITSAGVPWIDGLALPQLDGHPLRHVWIIEEAANGHTVIGRSPGVVAAGLPAYWLSGSDTFSMWPGALTAALLTALALVFFFLALRPRLGDRHALLASAVFGFATPVWSVSANGIWPHTLTVLGICGMAWAASRERWWLVGLFGGVALWGRLHVALIVAVVGVLIGWRRRDPLVTVRVALASGAALLGTCAWSRWMYGSWDPTSSYDAGAFTGYADAHRFDLVNQLGFWISPDRGILVWTPVIVLLLPALARSWRSLPDWSRALLLGGLAYSLVQLTFNRFSGGYAIYGYRIGLEMLAASAPALAFASTRIGPVARRLIGPVLGIQVFAILVGACIESFFVIPEEVWQRNAFANALVVAPLLFAPLVPLAVLAGWLGQRA